MYYNQRVSTSSSFYHAITRYSKPGIDYSTKKRTNKIKNISGSFVDILDFCGVAWPPGEGGCSEGF